MLHRRTRLLFRLSGLGSGSLSLPTAAHSSCRHRPITSLHLRCATRHIRPTAAGCGASARPHRPRHRRHDPRHHRHRHRHRHPQRRQHHDLLREPPARTADARTRRGWGTQATARIARTLRATARPRRGSTSTTPCMATWQSSTATATAVHARACYRGKVVGFKAVRFCNHVVLH